MSPLIWQMNFNVISFPQEILAESLKQEDSKSFSFTNEFLHYFSVHVHMYIFHFLLFHFGCVSQWLRQNLVHDSASSRSLGQAHGKKVCASEVNSVLASVV